MAGSQGALDSNTGKLPNDVEQEARARTFVGSGSGPLGVGAHFEINGIAVKR
jgi:hypothetical protein